MTSLRAYSGRGRRPQVGQGADPGSATCDEFTPRRAAQLHDALQPRALALGLGLLTPVTSVKVVYDAECVILA